VTLAALTAVRGIALLITNGYSTPIDSTFLLPLGQGKLLGLYTPTWIAIVIVAGAWYVFNQTRFGRYIVALGSNAESLRRSGVNVRRLQLAALVMTGVFASVAGIVTATRLASGSSNSGTLFELEVITAVVLGGTSLMGGRGSIMGSAIGALTLGVISNGLVLLHVNVYWVPIVQGTILVVAIFVNSTLFGRILGSRR
jgi:simple sugar transport system permease protein